MINIKGYQEAVKGLRELLSELRHHSEDEELHLVALHRFEVLTNISESILRRVYASINPDELVQYLSVRELLRQAGDDGVLLSSIPQWLRYLTALETIREQWMESAVVRFDAEALDLLDQFVSEVQAFADRVERLVSVVAD